MTKAIEEYTILVQRGFYLAQPSEIRADLDPFEHEKNEGSAWFNKQCPYVQQLVRDTKQAIELLQEWHDLHFESNRTLDADETATNTQKFLIETEVQGQ